jgi:hypothetical protein
MQKVEFCAEAHSNQHSVKTQGDSKSKSILTPKPLHGADAKGAEKDMLKPYAN